MSRDRWMRLAGIGTATVVLAAGVVGCGGDDGGDGGDGPAAAAPANSALYFEASVRPEADQAAAIEAIAARFPGGQDIGATITEQLNQSIAEEQPDFTYEEDIEPWLGERSGVFFLNFNDDADGAVVVDVTDDDAARAAIEKASENESPETRDIAGEEAIVQDDGDASVVADGRLIAGSEAGVEAALETAAGEEDSLGGSDGFDESVDRVGGEDALGYLQVNIGEAINQASQGGTTDPEQIRQILEQSGVDPEGEFAMSLQAEDDAVRSELSLPFDPPGDVTSPGLIGDVPGDAILAFGAADVGEGFSQGFEAGLEQSGQDADQVRSQIESQLGIDPSELGEVFGDAGFYVSGTNQQNLRAGALIEVTDTAKVQEVLSSARSALGPGARPLNVAGAEDAFSIAQTGAGSAPIELALAGDRLAISYGSGSAAATLAPQQPLSGSQTLSTAATALGDGSDPAFFADVQSGLALLETIGAFQGEPEYAQVKPYLAPLGLLASGVNGEEDGNLVTSLVLTFAGTAP